DFTGFTSCSGPALSNGFAGCKGCNAVPQSDRHTKRCPLWTELERAGAGLRQVDLTKEACHGSVPGMEAESESIGQGCASAVPYRRPRTAAIAVGRRGHQRPRRDLATPDDS